jgi:hypothetical protein
MMICKINGNTLWEVDIPFGRQIMARTGFASSYSIDLNKIHKLRAKALTAAWQI